MEIRFIDGELAGKTEVLWMSTAPGTLSRERAGFRYIYERVGASEFRYYRRERARYKYRGKAVAR